MIEALSRDTPNITVSMNLLGALLFADLERVRMPSSGL